MVGELRLEVLETIEKMNLNVNKSRYKLCFCGICGRSNEYCIEVVCTLLKLYHQKILNFESCWSNLAILCGGKSFCLSRKMKNHDSMLVLYLLKTRILMGETQLLISLSSHSLKHNIKTLIGELKPLILWKNNFWEKPGPVAIFAFSIHQDFNV